MDVHGQRSGSIQSVERAVAVLKLFGEAEPELGVSELARRLKLHKSTVSRLLATLQARGLVARDGDRFLPGPELARLGSLAIRGFALVKVARDPLARLAEETGEAVNLAVREDDRVLNVYQVGTAHFVGVKDWTGRATPLHCSANGKALLAFGDSLPAELPALTDRTITDPGVLRAELERVRERGFAVALEELEVGLHAVAAPVLDWSGESVAAVSVSAPSYRLPADRLDVAGARCRAAAEEISAHLGYRRAA